jgi:uncharacterized protein
MDVQWLDLVLYRDGRVRPAWRILLYFLLFALLTLVGTYAVSVLPAHPLQWGNLLAVTVAALGAGWVLLSRFDQRAPGALGFPLHRGAFRQTVEGTAIGAGLIALAIGILVLTRSATFVSAPGGFGEYLYVLSWTLLFFGVAAALEEAVFRGYPFQVLVEWIGAWPAILLASGLFSLLHAQNPNVTALGLANIFVAGVMLSIAYLRTRSLWFATGVHLGWNWAMATLFDFPVSGLVFETPLYSGLPTGAEWWTGGAFGPEAGLVGTLVLFVGTIWLLRGRRFQPDPEIQRLEPIVNRRLGKEAL